MDRASFILENTVAVSPLMCPEIRLHLITDACRLWYATEADLLELAIGDPYWGFCWPGGQVLARYVLDRPEMVSDRRVMVFGAGCGIEAVAAIKSGARFVTAADIDPFAAEATRLNGLLNGATIDVTTRNVLGDPLEEYEVVLAGDMFYDPAFTRTVMAWLADLASAGKRVLLADPRRGNLTDPRLAVLATCRAPADIDTSGKYLQDAVVYELTAGGQVLN